jgi:predicted porin
MKKIAIAAVLAASSIVASAQVGVSGKISQWADSTTTGSAKSNGMAMEPTSNIAISASEDLGKGLKARVVVETSLSGNTVTGSGTQLGDRQSTVGIANKLGSVDLGRNVHSQFLAITNNDSFGTLYGSVAGDVHNLRGLRFSNAAFVTVSPIKGVTASLDRSNNAVGADQTSYSIGAKVAGVNTTVAVYESGVEKSTVIGANAKFGPTGVFYTYSDNKSATVNETKKGNLVGLTYDVGAYTGKASYGETNKNVTAYSLGLDYHLSKRTDIGIAYRNVNMSSAANDIAQIGVGLTHRF